MYPGNSFDKIWESQKDQLKAKRIRLRWVETFQKVKPKTSKQYADVKSIWDYYLSHCSYHGSRYWLDKQLHPLARMSWVLIFLIVFGFTLSIIFHIHNNFKLRKSKIVIDEVNADIGNVPFPSITVCPPSRVDWVKALEMADELIPKGNEKAKRYFLELLDSAADMQLSGLDVIRLNTNDSTVLHILNEVNLTKLFLDVLPDCESFIFNCSWNYLNQSCCDIFDLQRSFKGFCYSFNSQTSEKRNHAFLRTRNYGINSGLRFSTLRADESRLPPSFRALNYQISMPLMISNVHVIPGRVRYFAFGRNYYVSLKFTCSGASDELIALETTPNPPCKHDNGNYKYENCLLNCLQKYLEHRCKCFPPYFFNSSVSEEYQSCSISGIACVGDIANKIDFLATKKACSCSNECDYVNYDDFIGAIPTKQKDRMLIDVHFDSQTGVCYNRMIVISTLDMLVQFGGIFGLFVGGSVISVTEFLYAILRTLYAICSKFLCFKKKEKRKIRLVIEVN